MAVELTLTIPDAYIPRILAAARRLEDSHVALTSTLSAYTGVPTPPLHGGFDYPDQGAMSDVDYVKLLVKSFLLACVEMKETEDAAAADQAARDALPPTVVDIPEDMIS